MNNQASHQSAYQQTKFVKNLWDHDGPVVLYKNSRVKCVNFAFVIALSTSVLCTYFVCSMSVETLTKEFSSLLSGRIWQGIFLLAGNILLFYMLRYRNTYITKIELKPYKQVVITAWDLGKRKTWVHDALEFKSAHYHQGQTILPAAPLVHAPYLKLQTNNRKTYLLDMQGHFPKGYPAIHKVFNP